MKYVIDEKKKKLIDCIPDVEDYYLSETRPRIRVATQELDVVVPDGVERIAPTAFDRITTYVQTIELPDTVKKLYAGQFKRLIAIEELKIGRGVSNIPAGLMHGNYSVKKVIIPDTVKIIHSSAFAECSNLETVVIEGSGLEKIDSRAFWECRNLKHINFPSSLKSIEREAFHHAGLEEIYFDHTVDFSWGWFGAFGFCNLKRYDAIFDDGRRIIRRWDSEGAATSELPAGNCVEVIIENGQKTTRCYDNRGRVVSEETVPYNSDCEDFPDSV